MAKLSALSDPAAVLSAISEFDKLGRDAFLKRHGYKRARQYVAIHNGVHYDSKALAGVALKYQYPDDAPLTSKDFSGGEATVKRVLSRLGFHVEQFAEPKIRNNWTREETILALDLLVRRRPQLPDQNDKEVLALSTLLRGHAQAVGLKTSVEYRNADGVSMKLANLSRLDPKDGRKGLPHGAKTEDAVWAEFSPDFTGLSEAASVVRKSMEHEMAGVEQPAIPIVTSNMVIEPIVSVSHGPRPSFGSISHLRADGDNCVYVMQLSGPLDALFPGRNLTNEAVIKVGRTNDLVRRTAELNNGFPPGIAIKWELMASRTFKSAFEAHDAEQEIIKELHTLGFTIGREYSIVPASILYGLIKVSPVCQPNGL